MQGVVAGRAVSEALEAEQEGVLEEAQVEGAVGEEEVVLQAMEPWKPYPQRLLLASHSRSTR